MRRSVLCLVAVVVAVALGAVALIRPASAPAEEGTARPAAAQTATAAPARAQARRRAGRRPAPDDRPVPEADVGVAAPDAQARTPSSDSARRSRATRSTAGGCVELWRKRALAARRQAHNPPRLRVDVHPAPRGPWNDPNAPYYGGLQMDIRFQRLYGAGCCRRKGTADNWTPLEQIWVAERAYRSGRGFHPWPNTARSCGLI